MSQNLRLRLALMGGGGGSFVPPDPEGYISFTDGPNVVLVDHSTTDVSATCTTTDLTPSTVDHYYGIWLSTSNPSTADVIAGTGAVYHNSDAGIASGVEVTFSFAAVTADISYTLHWVGRHEAENKQTRGTSVIFMLANAPPTGQPVITGTVVVGETLTNDPSAVADPDGLGPFSYQWYRVNSAIAGATNSTYVVQGADEFQTLKTAVAYIDGAGKTEGPIYSDPTIPVPEYNRPATGAPLIQGTVAYQETVTAGLSNINDQNGVPDYGTNPELWSFQWNRDGAPISGATDISYLIAAADINTNLTVSASFTDNAGFPEGPLTSTSHLVPDTNIEYFKDFSLSDNTGWTHTRGSVATMHDYLGNIVTVNGTDANDEAFVGSEYTDPDTYVDHGVGYGIQLEAESTNLLQHSNDFTNAAWGKASGIDTVEGGRDGIHGLSSALITTTFGDTNTKYVRQNRFTLGDTACYQGFFRYVNWRYVSLRAGGSPRSTFFDFETETFTNVASANSGFTRLGGGWYHLWTVHTNCPNTWAGFAICDASGNEGHDPGVAAQIEVAQHQGERSGFPTSMIVSGGAAQTRAATNLSAPFSALSPLPAGGVVNDFCFQVVKRLTIDQNQQHNAAPIMVLVSESDNRDSLTINQGFGHGVRMQIKQNNVTLANTSLNQAFVAGDILDIRGLIPSSGPVKLWVNGTLVTSSITNFTGFAQPLVEQRLGTNTRATTEIHKGEHQYTRIIPAALTDEEITGWPTWSEPVPEITQQPTDIDLGGAPPGIKQGVIFQTDFTADWDEEQQTGWTYNFATGDRVTGPTGFWAADGSEAGCDPGTAIFRVERDPIYNNVAMRYRYGSQTEPPPSNPRSDIFMTAAIGTKNRGYQEFYLRYRYRFATDINFNDGEDLGYWKLFRVNANCYVPTGPEDRYDVSAQNRHKNAVSAQSLLQSYGKPLLGGRGFGLKTRWHNQNEGYEHTTTFLPDNKYDGGDWANLDPDNKETEEAWEHPTVPPGNFVYQGEQTYHTLEVYVKGASAPEAGDGEFRLWYDGVEQIGHSNNGLGTPQQPWSDFAFDDDTDSKKWHPDVLALPISSPTAYPGKIGYNSFDIFGNQFNFNKTWAGLEAGLWFSDVVISTERIGHDYAPVGYHNSSIEDAPPRTVGALEIISHYLRDIDFHPVGYLGSIVQCGFFADNTVTWSFWLTRDSGGGEIDMSTEPEKWNMNWGAWELANWNAYANNSIGLESIGVGLEVNDTGYIRVKLESIDGVVWSDPIRLAVTA